LFIQSLLDKTKVYIVSFLIHKYYDSKYDLCIKILIKQRKEVIFHLDTSDAIQLIILVVLLFLSAFFSSAETALTSVNRIKMKTLADDGNKRAQTVLDVLEKSDVKDVCVVATRYFGGILLGGGGLVRAYSHTAKIALDSGEIITMTKCDEFCVVSDYNYYGRLVSLISENGGTGISADFADNVKVCFSIPCEKTESIKKLIVDSSNGRFFAEKTGEKYAEI